MLSPVWMKNYIFSEHAEKRRRQRGLTKIEMQYTIEHHKYQKKRKDGISEVIGTIRNRTIKIAYKEKENYIKIISVM
jgi:uncharacterized membrane-anchored protein